MKNSFLILLFLSTTVLVNAQDEIYKTVAKETCECFDKRKAEVKNQQEAEMALGICMITSAQTNKVDVDLTDEEVMRIFGEKVGIQMAFICPTAFDLLMNSDEEVPPVGLTGKIKSVEVDEFLSVILKEESGKEHKLLWVRYFPGSDDFKDNPKKLIGKNVTVEYETTECYFPKMKAYYSSKEIRDLKVN